jgi:hypothetical protein
MLSLKRWRKSRKPSTDPQPSSSKISTAITPAGADGQGLPVDPQPSSSKISTAITPAGADGQGLPVDPTSGARLEPELEQLTLQARSDVTQEQAVVTDL